MIRNQCPLFALLFSAALLGCNDRGKQTSSVTPSNDPVMTRDVANLANHSVCNLVAVGDSHVAGTIRFIREGGSIHVTGEVSGLTPGQHGFHVHESGDLSDTATGKSTGGHFNPAGHEHGKPADTERHVGDLGNIDADKNGVAKIDLMDTIITFTGTNSILGRGLVIHAKADQFTQPTGDAGDRVAMGVIEEQKP